MRSFSLFLLAYLLMCVNTFGDVGDVWDTRTQWSNVNNPNVLISPPFGTWSYHSENGILMVQATGGCGGSPSDWSTAQGGCPDLFNDNWGPIGGIGEKEFAGHGPWVIRWTSPVNGYVRLNGKLWQMFETSRRMAYFLRQNRGAPFAYDFVLQDTNGDTILGRPGVVKFDSIYRSVKVGDTIDFFANGWGPGGDGSATFAVGRFTITQVDKSEVPLEPALIDGDVNRDNCVNIFDLAALSSRWLNFDCDVPRWCEGTDINKSRTVNLSDYRYLANNWNKCAQRIAELHNLGFVVISPTGPLDGSDFGPSTWGTQTAGWQEAIDFAVANNRDVYVFGGGMPGVFLPPVMYTFSTTLYVPPAENLRITGGDYLLDFPNTNTDCIIFDSQKNCEFDLGCILADNIENGSSIIKVKPQTVRPDGRIGFSNGSFLVNFFVGGGSVWGQGVIGRGTAWHFDGSLGPIENSHFVTMEINACNTGFWLEQGEITNNIFESPFDHTTNNMLVVNCGSYNRFNVLFDPGGVGGPVIGANLNGGQENIYTFAFNSPADMKPLIIGPNAQNNVIYAMGLPHDSITNNSVSSTNRIIPAKPVGFNVPTPVFP